MPIFSPEKILAGAYAEIAVPLPIPGPFTYTVPEELQPKIRVGARVRVPFRNREIVGYVTALPEIPPVDENQLRKLKSLSAVLDETPVISATILGLTKKISLYYGCSWGEAIENALPKWVKYGKKPAEDFDEGAENALIPPVDLALSPDQKSAFEKIVPSLENPHPKPILLHGVTGSGKSELYIRTIREVLKKGKSAICLVPEIALTEQIRRFFILHFGKSLEILHSKLSDSERFKAWQRIQKGQCQVVLGPRSAVFAPVSNLGLLIMDEEHEGSYKQETTPRYHARDAATWRAEQENALFLMGSATPSLETMYQTKIGNVELLRLATRIDEKDMPEVHVIDLKDLSGPRKKGFFSLRLLEEIETNLRKKEGTILLLNRRGFSTHVSCPKCALVESCPSCQVSLTFHQQSDILLCHYCNFQKKASAICSQCRMPLLRFTGFGTEKVESELAAHFPVARIARMDADSVRKKGSHEEILKKFRDQQIDILIGTQMIAKGFDFPHVTLVGVVLADVGLSLPDFRSAERTFQLMTQVAGRAGRGKNPGRVFIQTFSPEHPSIVFAKKHDYPNFYQHEAKEREQYGYPPFKRLINVIIRSHDENKAYKFAREFREGLKQAFEASSASLTFEIIGPAPLPFYKLRGHFRWHVMLKLPLNQDVTQLVREAIDTLKKPSDVAYALDVDPLNIL